MDQVKIGILIAQCRKNKKMTQKQLAEKLGVTDKSVSKWENGICLPDVALYKPLCEVLGITLNEFFAGEILSNEAFKKVADNNLLSALENSAFTLKDKIDFYKKKWEKDHLFAILLIVLIIVFFIIYGFIKDNGVQYVFMVIGLICGVIENNKKDAYIEKNAYGPNSSVSTNEFRTYIKRMQEFKVILTSFPHKKDAINYLMEETGLSKEECQKTYDIIIKIDFVKINE